MRSDSASSVLGTSFSLIGVESRTQFPPSFITKYGHYSRFVAEKNCYRLSSIVTCMLDMPNIVAYRQRCESIRAIVSLPNAHTTAPSERPSHLADQRPVRKPAKRLPCTTPNRRSWPHVIRCQAYRPYYIPLASANWPCKSWTTTTIHHHQLRTKMISLIPLCGCSCRGSNPVLIVSPPELAGMTLESRLVSYDWENQFDVFQKVTRNGSFRPICTDAKNNLVPVSIFIRF